MPVMRREIFVGSVGIGGNHAVSIQSMTNTDTRDVDVTLAQIRALATAGCEIVRVALPAHDAVDAFGLIVRDSFLPVIADVHFDASLALAAIEAGAHGLRINPGNIGDRRRLVPVIRSAAERGTPIRIGVNAGSLEKRFRDSAQPRYRAMVDSLMQHVRFFRDQGFELIKISLKSSRVKETVAANRLVVQACNYPIHLGVTEAGSGLDGEVKSAVGIGALLLDGIGDTIRVSLTADPVREVRVAKALLAAVGLRRTGVEVISCPTCARTSVDLIPLVERVKSCLAGLKSGRRLTVAVMGCEVNGPGEARDADVGLAFSRTRGFIFRNGKVVARVEVAQAVERLEKEVRRMLASGE
ncbi:MAG TPA: flavodoxin-dependent (E)-4-hydroxy-3-methylbut-2-enyl-diphosphate synthase [Candidatus Aminicenantes bacterium]|nr:flavodoxin-dependent (E)-4-hydroxy-3-methylbut-2-enyl-diphosphate synthase [Candidatus Aminicenantes bacterium]